MPSASHRPRTTKDASTFPSPQLLQRALSTHPPPCSGCPPGFHQAHLSFILFPIQNLLRGPGKYRGDHTSSFSTLNKGFISQSLSLLRAPARSAPQDCGGRASTSLSEALLRAPGSRSPVATSCMRGFQCAITVHLGRQVPSPSSRGSERPQTICQGDSFLGNSCTRDPVLPAVPR